MWYNFAWPDSQILKNRTEPGHSTEAMFLQATIDCLQIKKPIHLVVALGVLERLCLYLGGWYEKEITIEADAVTNIDRAGSLLQSLQLSQIGPHIDKKNHLLLNRFHPTRVWADLFRNILALDQLCRSQNHELTVVHMSTDHDSPFLAHHVLINPLWGRVKEMSNYLHSSDHSCTRVCRLIGIDPWDCDQYGHWGHHGPTGQKYFGEYIHKILQQRKK